MALVFAGWFLFVHIESIGETMSGSNSGNDDRRLASQDAYKLFLERETWCAVERKKEQDWCRTQRKHHPDQYKSRVLERVNPSEDEPRCTFKVNKSTHRQRRHYADNCTYVVSHFISVRLESTHQLDVLLLDLE